MRSISRIRRLVSNLFGKQQLEGTLEAELLSHLDELTDRNLARGLSPEEARRQALIETGGIEQVKEEVRGQWLGHGIETTLQDIRYTVRSLMRAPGFTARPRW